MSKQNINKTDATSVKANANLVCLSMNDVELKKPDVSVAHNYAIWVHALLQNWRQGTVACKDRGEVKYSTKKPWKQKGTGRARAGSARSPIWRGGGVTFGPQARTRTLKLSKRAKADVMKTLFAEFVENQRIVVLDWQANIEKISTKASFEALKNVGIETAKLNLFLCRDDTTNWMAFRNLKNINMLSFDDVNAYDFSNGQYLVVLKKDLNELKEMVSKWN